MHTLAIALIAAVMLASAAAPAQSADFHRDPTRGVLVTGAASGIGRATALRFREAGYTVYATDRDTTRWGDLESAGCETLYLDVTDEASIVAARETIEAGAGGSTCSSTTPATAKTG